MITSTRTALTPARKTGGFWPVLLISSAAFGETRETLCVHSMGDNVLRSHRKKGSRSDMQRHESVRNLAQDLGREMETRRRRGYGPGSRAKTVW